MAVERAPVRRVAALAAGAALLAGLAAAVPAHAAATPRRHVPCTDVAVSPAFASDHTVFCGAPNADASGVDLYRSTDAGHTWKGPYPVERLAGYHQDDVLGIYVSPAYRTDRTLYVGAASQAAWVSTNGGLTFHRPGPSALVGLNTPGLYRLETTIFLNGTPGGTTPPRAGLLVTQAGPPAGCCDTVVDPFLPPRTYDPGPQVISRKYIVAPDYPSTHQSVVLGGQMSIGPQPVPSLLEGHARAYGCVDQLGCTTLLYDFPPLPGDNAEGVGWADATYPAGPDNYAVVVSGVWGEPDSGKPRIFRSADYGHTWTLWTSATKLLPTRTNSYSEFFINASPDTPHRLFLHVIGGSDRPTDPDYQLYRSDNNGASWHRIGYAWGPEQKALTRSTLPWNYSAEAYRPTVVASGGRLYLIAEHDTGKHTDYLGLYCSRDYGAHWSTSC
jgi:hypothetical protein